jgi:hypothetical protein
MKIENLRYYRDCVTAQKITVPFTSCEKCSQNMLDGTAKCPSCYISMEAWSDNRIARSLPAGKPCRRDQYTTIQP